jgi:hypothetical protein
MGYGMIWAMGEIFPCIMKLSKIISLGADLMEIPAKLTFVDDLLTSFIFEARL